MNNTCDKKDDISKNILIFVKYNCNSYIVFDCKLTVSIQNM